MTCPKCEVAALEKVVFKVDGRVGYHCDDCDTFWFAGEVMSATTGHALSGFRKDDKEYTLERMEMEDPDSEPVRYSKYT